MYSTSREYIDIVVSSLSGATGVKTQSGKGWAFNMEDKVLVYDALDLTQRPFMEVRGLVLHEMGHVMYSKAETSSPLWKKYPRLGLVYNAFEDIRVEGNLIGQFGSFAHESLLALNDTAYLDLFYRDWHSQDPLYQALVMADYYTATNGHFHDIGWRLSKDAQFAYDYMHPESKKVLKKMFKDNVFGSWTQKTLRSPSFRKLQEFVDSDVFPYIEELLKQYPQSAEEAEGAAAVSKSEDKAEVTSRKDGNKLVVGGFQHTDRMPQFPVPPYKEASLLMRPYASVLATRLNDILEEKASTRYVGLKKTGKLLGRNASKIATGEDRIYSKRTTPDSPYHKIYIALDASGSMDQESKASWAYLTAVLLYDTTQRMRMPIEVISFGDNPTVIASDQNMSSSFKQWGPNQGGTRDSRVVEMIANKVKKEFEQPIVFIIGDGDGDGISSQDVDTIQSKGYMMGIGIGNNCGSVAKRYPNGRVVPNPSDVPKVIIKTLREIIKR